MRERRPALKIAARRRCPRMMLLVASSLQPPASSLPRRAPTGRRWRSGRRAGSGGAGGRPAAQHLHRGRGRRRPRPGGPARGARAGSLRPPRPADAARTAGGQVLLVPKRSSWGRGRRRRSTPAAPPEAARLEVEPFGGGTVVVRAVPGFLAGREVRPLLVEIAAGTAAPDAPSRPMPSSISAASAPPATARSARARRSRASRWKGCCGSSTPPSTSATARTAVPPGSSGRRPRSRGRFAERYRPPGTTGVGCFGIQVFGVWGLGGEGFGVQQPC